MTPDIETYAPFINAVFGSPEDNRLRIHYSLADRNIRSQSSIIESFLSLLDLPDSRFSASFVINLLQTPEIRDSFAIKEENLHSITNWVISSGIRWGADSSTREKLNLPGFEENTWKSGLDRLLLGYALPSGEERIFGNILGYDHIEGSQGEILGNLLDFFQSLVEFSKKLEQQYTLSQWSELLLSLLDKIFTAGQEKEPDLIALRGCIMEICTIEQDYGFSDPVSLEVIKAYLSKKLGERSLFPGFITGGVTFCAMLPMRSIPFKIVGLLGINDDSFPRKSSFSSWNLIAESPRKGDRSLELEDRYLFLEALLSAREIFYISYIGKNQNSDTLRRPSVLVEELLQYIDEKFLMNSSLDDISPDVDQEIEQSSLANQLKMSHASGILTTTYNESARDNVLTGHRLQAFSPAYFTPHSNLFSYSHENLKAALEMSKQDGVELPFFSEPLSGPSEEFKNLNIKDLIAFYQNPAKFLLLRRMGILLDFRVEQISEDEPFDLGGLFGYGISEQLLNKALAGNSYEHCYTHLKAAGYLPHGTVGEYYYDNLAKQVFDFANSVKRFQKSPGLSNIVIDNDIGSFHISGRIDHIDQNSLIQYRFAKLKPVDYLRAWINHLFLNSFRPAAYPGTTILLGRNATIRFNPVENALKQLESMLSVYWKGQSFPVPFFPAASWAYSETLMEKGKTEEESMSYARKMWSGDEFAGIPAESGDPYFSLCFRSVDPLDDSFKKLSVQIFSPLIEHMEGLE